MHCGFLKFVWRVIQKRSVQYREPVSGLVSESRVQSVTAIRDRWAERLPPAATAEAQAALAFARTEVRALEANNGALRCDRGEPPCQLPSRQPGI
jgi:hypothetical protein